MEQYRIIINANIKKIKKNNNYVFDNLDNMIIYDTTTPYIEDEIKRLEWLRSQPSPFTISPPIISKEYQEECIKYCTEADEKQKKINELIQETTQQELKLIKAAHLKKAKEIKKDTKNNINFIKADIIDTFIKDIRSFKRIRCINDKQT